MQQHWASLRRLNMQQVRCWCTTCVYGEVRTVGKRAYHMVSRVRKVHKRTEKCLSVLFRLARHHQCCDVLRSG